MGRFFKQCSKLLLSSIVFADFPSMQCCAHREAGGMREGDAATVRRAEHYQEVPLPGRLRGILGAATSATAAPTAPLLLTQVIAASHLAVLRSAHASR